MPDKVLAWKSPTIIGLLGIILGGGSSAAIFSSLPQHVEKAVTDNSAAIVELKVTDATYEAKLEAMQEDIADIKDGVEKVLNKLER
jgi:hypothetical protein